jgi:hypothetical protein
MQKGRELFTALTEDVVLSMTKTEFKKYCCSAEYFNENATVNLPPTAYANPRFNAVASGIVGTVDALTAQKFRRGVKRDKTHYADFKDDKYFNYKTSPFA